MSNVCPYGAVVNALHLYCGLWYMERSLVRLGVRAFLFIMTSERQLRLFYHVVPLVRMKLWKDGDKVI